MHRFLGIVGHFGYDKKSFERRNREAFMRGTITGLFMLSAAFCVGPIHAQTAQWSLADVERRFDASLNAAEMAGWMRTMTAEPNHVGSPHNKANAEMVLAQFRDWDGTPTSKHLTCFTP